MSPTPSEMSMVSMVDFETSILDESIRRVSCCTLCSLFIILLLVLFAFNF